MPDTFEIAIGGRVRKVEFDPDPLLMRNVRILLDGAAIRETPFPNAETPYREVAFDLEGHAMVGTIAAATEPSEASTFGLNYDLFADGRSLTDGAALKLRRTSAPRKGDAYPRAFRAIDSILTIAPAAGAPGLFIGVSNAADELGWGAVAVTLGVLLALIAVATWIATSWWRSIRGQQHHSVLRRTAMGGAVVVGSYVGAFATAIVIVRGFI